MAGALHYSRAAVDAWRGERVRPQEARRAGGRVRGELQAAAARIARDEPGQDDLEGFSTNASVSWLPTQLTTVSVSATRSIWPAPAR